jgi:superfamily II DNA or RNA helicase
MGEGILGTRHVDEVIPDASYDYPGAFFRATPTQTHAVNFALGNVVGIIQGPPGCGKTAVIAALCHTLVTLLPGFRILVCGTSNVSIENLVHTILPVMQA